MSSFVRKLHIKILLNAFLLAAVLGLTVPTTAQQLNPEHLSQLSYRFIGPDGNRAIAVAGVPGDPLVS